MCLKQRPYSLLGPDAEGDTATAHQTPERTASTGGSTLAPGPGRDSAGRLASPETPPAPPPSRRRHAAGTLAPGLGTRWTPVPARLPAAGRAERRTGRDSAATAGGRAGWDGRGQPPDRSARGPAESALEQVPDATLRQGDKFGGRKAIREVWKEDVGLSHLEAQKREETSRRQRRLRCELSPEPWGACGALRGLGGWAARVAERRPVALGSIGPSGQGHHRGSRPQVKAASSRAGPAWQASLFLPLLREPR